MQNHYQEFREKIWVGSRLKCTRRLVDAEKYYTNKYEEAEEEWENLKKKANE